MKERFDSQGKFTGPHSCGKLKFAIYLYKATESNLYKYTNNKGTCPEDAALHIDYAQGEWEEHGVVCRECSAGCGGVECVTSATERGVVCNYEYITVLKMSHLVNFQVSVGLFAL